MSDYSPDYITKTEAAKLFCALRDHVPLAQVRVGSRAQADSPEPHFSCNGCGKEPESALASRCVRCKTVRYCDSACQLRDWRGDGAGAATAQRSHKNMCAELKHARVEFEESQTSGRRLRTEVFASWADQHHERSDCFFDPEFKLRRGVLGGAEVGYWAEEEIRMRNGVYMGFNDAGEKDVNGFLNGAMLLLPSFPSPEKGWKVLEEHREFPSGPPKRPPPTEDIRSWEEYLQYRELSASSIAPLLLTNVLTVYQMLHHCLKITRSPKSALTVLFLGAEVELNHIPLFAELAYLLPGVDLRIVMISPTVKATCEEAAKNPGSILHKASDGVVLDVRAPDENGGGRIRIQLDGRKGKFEAFSGPLPDAVIGPNAGVGSYPSWRPALVEIVKRGLPFAFSDHSILQINYISALLFPFLRAKNPGLIVPPHENMLNPFHGIVQRDTVVLEVAIINNGYILYTKP